MAIASPLFHPMPVSPTRVGPILLGPEPAAVPAALPSGHPSLDAELPESGWPRAMLTELIAHEPGIAEVRLLVPLLRQLARERKTILLLAPPDMPCTTTLAGFGLAAESLTLIPAHHAADRLWAVEQRMKSADFGVLLAWLPQDRTRPEHLRRLQAAALGARGPVFLLRELPAQFESSPAALRLLVLQRPEQKLSVQILKRRGPVTARPLLIDLPRSTATAASAASRNRSRQDGLRPPDARAGSRRLSEEMPKLQMPKLRMAGHPRFPIFPAGSTARRTSTPAACNAPPLA